MIPGILASMGLLKIADVVPIAFKGVAVHTNIQDSNYPSRVTVFQDNSDGSYTKVFEEVYNFNAKCTAIELSLSRLVVGFSTAPYIMVYTWDGTTFVHTWEATSAFAARDACISYDGEHVISLHQGGEAVYSTSKNNIGYDNTPTTIATTANAQHVTTNSDGTIVCVRHPTSIQFFGWSGSGWTSLSNTTLASSTATATADISTSRVGSRIYTATTNGPNTPIIRYLTVATGVVYTVRLSAISTQQSRYPIVTVSMSGDGEYAAFGWDGWSSALGTYGRGVVIYKKVANQDFELVYESPTSLFANIAAISLNYDGSKLFVQPRAASTVSDRRTILVLSRDGSTWTSSTPTPPLDQFRNLTIDNTIALSAN